MFLILGLLLASSLFAQEVYRWTDEEGNVHYGDRPPPEEETERVQIQASPSPEPVEDGEADSGQERNRPQLSEQECEGMRGRLEEYRSADTLYRINEEGEEEALAEEAAQAEIRRLESQIEDYCGGSDG
jgi:hypothetical protein